MNTNLVDPDEVFPQVEKMLYDQAWKFTRKYPALPFDEAKSQAFWAFVKACQEWNDFGHDRGVKFSTFCYFGVWAQLQNLVMARSKDRLVPCEINEEMVGAAPPERSEVLDLIHELPEDCKEIVHLLLEMPAELLGVNMTPRQLLLKVKKFLVEKHGKKRARVNFACNLLTNHLKQAWAA